MIRPSAILRSWRWSVAVTTVVLVVVSGCDAPTSPRPTFAYDPTTLSRGVLYRWPSGRVIYVWVSAETAATAPSLPLAVRQAIAVWNNVPTFGEFTLVMTTHLDEANIIAYDRASALPIVPGACAFDPQGSAGYTYLCPSATAPAVAQHFALTSGTPTAVSVVIRIDRGRATDQAAYSRLVMHEIGHALGIGGHSDRPSDLMFGAPQVDSPSAADIQTLRYLLGQRAALTL